MEIAMQGPNTAGYQNSRMNQNAAIEKRSETLAALLVDFDEQLKRLQERVQQASRLSDFFSGSRPEGPNSAQAQPMPVGYVSELSDRLRSMGRLISVLADEQGRAEALTIG